MTADAISPFVEYRHRLDLYALALARGLSDGDYLALVTETDRRVAAVDGTGFVTTPLVELEMAPRPGRVVAKVETAGVGQSHKARHLFGSILHHLILEQTDTDPGNRAGPGSASLAIASCGNAALGAAVVARAVERPLEVFVPVDADPVVVDRLDQLGAEVTHCPRAAGTVGDPCVAALDEAVSGGAVPFSVQGTRCPEVIDGARTLGLELAHQLDEAGVVPGAIYIQIGGGALATAVMDGLRRAWGPRPLPRLHPVQAMSAHPYVAAWRRLVAAVLGEDAPGPEASDHRRAALVAASQGWPWPPGTGVDLDLVAPATRVARSHPEAMQPWPGTPLSVASGILDDVTYDWVTVAAHQMASGGWPILVDEDTFVSARSLATAQVVPGPDETGAAGLAGWLTHIEAAAPDPGPAEISVVLLTGAAR